MCLYPRLLRNPKYKANKKNKGLAPDCVDERLRYVPVGCGECIECRKKKAREWLVRLNEELRASDMSASAHFVTLTFNEKSLEELYNLECDNSEETIDNAVYIRATRRFLERWRKDAGKSVKHWLINELGHNGTERLHIHGIIWGDAEMIKKHWKYGWVYIGNYVNEKTIGYIVKYVTKIDISHKWFKSKILCSPGIGKNYTKRADSGLNEFRGNETNETYRTRKGLKLALPMYYRNKLYTDEERELLWRNKLDEQVRYVLGIKIDVSTDEGLKIYEQALKEAQEKNIRLGYGKLEDWTEKKYKNMLKKLKT